MARVYTEELLTRIICVARSKHFPFGAAFFAGPCVEPGKYEGASVQVLARSDVLPKSARLPIPGDIWEVSGVLRPNPLDSTWPWQLNATRCIMHTPSGRFLFSFLQHRKEFRGLYVGQAKWKALFESFSNRPDDLLAALESGDLDALIGKGVLTPETAGRLIRAWRSVDRAEIEVATYLQNKGFPTHLAAKLQRVWGINVIHHLEANPYYLVAFEKWNLVDKLAQEVYSIANDDSRRLVGAVLAVLYARLAKGKHTLTFPADLRRLLGSLLKTNSASIVEKAIRCSLQKGVVVQNDDGGFQSDGASSLEARVKQKLLVLHNDVGQRQQELDFACCDQVFVDAVIARAEGEIGFRFTAEQKVAVQMAFTERVCVLCGGAGSGKTAVLRAIIVGLKLLHRQFFQVALAGRAARRMSESTGEEAMTIARFLNRIYGNELNISGCPHIFIDEGSMVDLPTMDRILRLLKPGARLLFVGDQNQLPPIQFGLVFHRLVQSKIIPRTELTIVKRSSDESRIAEIALQIRNKRLPVLQGYPERAAPGVSFIECGVEEINQSLLRVYSDLNDPRGIQVLSIRNDEKHGGARHINWAFQDMMDRTSRTVNGVERPTYTPIPHQFWERFSEGDKVMYLENDPETGLNNGTLGRVITAAADGVVCEFDGLAAPVPIGPERVDKITLAYAVTVHKAQGSQWRRIVIPIVKSPNLLDNAMIYTAVTRATDQVVLIGDREAYEAAVQGRSRVEERQVAFTI